MQQPASPSLSSTAQEILAAIAWTVLTSRMERADFHHLTGHYREEDAPILKES